MTQETKALPRPTEIKLHQVSKILEIAFDDGENFQLSCEYLRISSPSAEVRGHGPGQETLQLDKEEVNITSIEPVGTYAVKLFFDDGHNTGLYTWKILYELGANFEYNWQNYLQRLKDAGHERQSLQDS